MKEIKAGKEKTDRRVKYTKALLTDALVSLLQKEPISSISVTRLCELADVNRTTFYAHYTDQYDLLYQTQAEVMTNIKRYIEEKSQDYTYPVSERNLVSILEYGKKNSALITVLLGENSGDIFQRDILEYVRLFGFSDELHTDDVTKEYISLFMVNGCLSIIRRWLFGGMAESTAEIAKLILQLVCHGYSKYS